MFREDLWKWVEMKNIVSIFYQIRYCILVTLNSRPFYTKILIFGLIFFFEQHFGLTILEILSNFLWKNKKNIKIWVSESSFSWNKKIFFCILTATKCMNSECTNRTTVGHKNHDVTFKKLPMYSFPKGEKKQSKCKYWPLHWQKKHYLWWVTFFSSNLQW